MIKAKKKRLKRKLVFMVQSIERPNNNKSRRSPHISEWVKKLSSSLRKNQKQQKKKVRVTHIRKKFIYHRTSRIAGMKWKKRSEEIAWNESPTFSELNNTHMYSVLNSIEKWFQTSVTESLFLSCSTCYERTDLRRHPSWTNGDMSWKYNKFFILQPSNKRKTRETDVARTTENHSKYKTTTFCAHKFFISEGSGRSEICCTTISGKK